MTIASVGMVTLIVFHIEAYEHTYHLPEKSKTQAEDWFFMGTIGFEPMTTIYRQTNLRYVAQSVFHPQQSMHNHFS